MAEDSIKDQHSFIRMESLPTQEGGSRDERRYPVRLFNYWNKQRGYRLFPSEEKINPEEISEIWPHCFLIQTNDLKNRHRADFTYLGSEILHVYHDYLADADANDFVSPKTSHLSQNFQTVLDTKAPIMQSGEFFTSWGNTIRFRQCLLPLGDTDLEVMAIFGCARLKLYP